MTKERLEQFRHIEAELRHIRADIKYYRELASKHIAEETTSVLGSRHEIPYDVVSIPITGASAPAKAVRERNLELLRQKEDELQQELLNLENWLSSIDDPLISDIFRLRYRNNMKWEDIGEEVGYHRTRVSQIHDAYLRLTD